MTYSETLKARISNASELLSSLSRCNVLLAENKIEDFFEVQAGLKSLFDAEDRLAKDMEGFGTEHAVGESESSKNLLLKTLRSAYKLVGENKKQLGKTMKSILKEQKKHDAIGNAASKYYPPLKIIPKFIDLKS